MGIVELIRNLADFPDEMRGGAVTIGNFDGVHRGHAQLIASLKELAQKVGGPATVFTFEPHPARVLRPTEVPPPLTWTERKAELLETLDVDALIAFPTDEKLLGLDYQTFFKMIVLDSLGAKAMVEGPNFYFGRNREGNIETLAKLCRDSRLILQIADEVDIESEIVSSSRIRKLIAAGELALAARLLGRPYRIRGMVTHGAGRGAQLGFPTANVDAIDTLIPAPGVYVGRAYCDDVASRAAINVGHNPTFGESLMKVEVHLLDAQPNLYGKPLEVDFLYRLRDVQSFDSVDQLKLQVEKDVAQVRNEISKAP